MSATLATESATVQNPLVRYAGDSGWEIVPQSEAVSLRKGETEAGNYSRSGTTKDKAINESTRSGITCGLERLHYTL